MYPGFLKWFSIYVLMQFYMQLYAWKKLFAYATMNKMSSEKCLIQFLVTLLSLVSWSLEFTIHNFFVNSSEFLFYQSTYLLQFFVSEARRIQAYEKQQQQPKFNFLSKKVLLYWVLYLSLDCVMPSRTDKIQALIDWRMQPYF